MHHTALPALCTAAPAFYIIGRYRIHDHAFTSLLHPHHTAPLVADTFILHQTIHWPTSTESMCLQPAAVLVGEFHFVDAFKVWRVHSCYLRFKCVQSLSLASARCMWLFLYYRRSKMCLECFSYI
jgi:hypothetical protein